MPSSSPFRLPADRKQLCGPELLDIFAAICYPFAKQTVSEASVISQQYGTDLFFHEIPL
jgi:hypothetical protein